MWRSPASSLVVVSNPKFRLYPRTQNPRRPPTFLVLVSLCADFGLDIFWARVGARVWDCLLGGRLIFHWWDPPDTSRFIGITHDEWGHGIFNDI